LGIKVANIPPGKKVSKLRKRYKIKNKKRESNLCP
jgi:hypothetical protein